MKNKKIIFLVVTVCCLAVCWFCFGAWTLADTSYQLSDFQYSTSAAYLYIVPSSNIPFNEYSNIQVSGVYTNPGSSSTVQTSAFAGTLSSFSSNTTGLYLKSSTAFSVNRAVRLDVGISAIDTSIGTYVITGSYIVDSTPSLVASPSYRVFSNFSYAQIGSSQYRTLILFIDKVSTSGVPQEQYDELLQRYEDLEYDFSDLESDYDDLYIEVQEYIALYEQELALNTALNTQVAELQARIDSLESGGTALDFVGTAFEKVGDILQIEILPNITIGTIVAVPLILGVVFLVLRLVRGE